MAAKLIMVLHCHQPVGSSPDTLHRACATCYQPLLESLQRHPRVKLALHFSGFLLEWLEHKQRRCWELLAGLCERGQVEMLAGGFYEPVLPALPYQDGLGQLLQMQTYLREHLASAGTGVWLAQLAWEPELVNLLAEAGARYTLVDAPLLVRAGWDPRQPGGYWLTERHGQTLAVFPADALLRQALVRLPVGQVLQLLEQKLGDANEALLVYADDGEKFGYWPTAANGKPGSEWWTEWLEVLEGGPVQTLTPADWLDQYPPRGRLYLPSGCRFELQSLPLPNASRQHWQELRQQLEKQQLWEPVSPWLDTGPWQNFLARYPEANHLHKKMLRVSGKLLEALESGHSADEELWQSARRHLFRGQCHDAYWHGPEAGLYQPLLRHACYQELIEAEVLVDQLLQGQEDWIALEELDLDTDGSDEIIIENRLLTACIDPDQGGTVCELDYRPRRFCLTNTMTRWPETYHRLLDHGTGWESGAGDTPPLPGEGAAAAPDPGLRERLVVETRRRGCFMDRFPSPDTTLEQIFRGGYREEGDFLDGRYRVLQAAIDEAGDCDCQVVLSREGVLRRGEQRLHLACRKELRVPVERAELHVSYTLQNLDAAPWEVCFAPEVNLNLLAGDSGDHLYEFAGLIGPGPRLRSMGELDQATWFALVDQSQLLRLRLECDPPATIWRHPVETISLNRGGFELLYQGSALLFRWRWELPPGQEQKVNLRLQVQQLDPDGVVPVEE